MSDVDSVIIEAEVRVSMNAYIVVREGASRAFLDVEINYGHSTIVRINAPEDVLDQLWTEGRMPRLFILEATPTDNGAGLAFKRIIVNNTEYWLTSI